MDTQEARIYTLVLIISVTLGIIISYFIVSIIRQQRRNLQIQKRAMLAEITAMEKERERIAADLHDDLGPVLAVIQFQVDNIETVSGEERQQLNEASKHLDGLIARVREIANNLMPTTLHRKGLLAAIDEFTAKAGTASGLAIHFSHPQNLSLPNEMNVHIFRIVQEIVHNCIKHAKATKLEIVILEKKDHLTLLCKDDGQGFNYDAMEKASGGIGLKSLKNRTELMGGTFEAESKEGRGAAFLFQIPIR